VSGVRIETTPFVTGIEKSLLSIAQSNKAPRRITFTGCQSVALAGRRRNVKPMILFFAGVFGVLSP
jgi:hypothetical protein